MGFGGPGNTSGGDPGGTLRLKFTTRATTGIPTTLAGSPVVSIYKDDSTTQSTAGVTLTADFDSVTGLNHLVVDTSADGTFYASGSHFEAVITTGTVGGTSVVGEVVGSFDLYTSVTAARVATAVWQDATSGDFTASSSIGKSLYTSGAVPGAAGGHFIAGTNAATVITTSLTTHLIGTVDTVTNLTNAPTSGDFTATMKASITTAVPTAAVNAAAVWNEINTGATHNVNNSTGKQLRTLATNTAVIYTATAPSQAGMTSTQIKLDSGASASDNIYQWDVVSIISGTDAGDSRIATAYNGTSKILSVNAPWTVQPDNTSVFEITPTAATQVVSYISGQDPATLVWAAATRILTAGTNIVLAKGTGITGFNDITAGSVFDVTLASHLNTGSTGAALNAAGSAGDPWATAVPGAYGSGTAGFILGTNLNAAVTSDTGGVTTLLSRLTSTRAGNLDFLDLAISTRSTYAGADTAGTTTLLGRLTGTRAGLLDNLTNLDAPISGVSTYAGADTAGTTTLLARIGSAITISGGGVVLASTGLDAIDASEVSGVPSTFRDKLVWVFQRLARVTKTFSGTTGSIVVKTAAGGTATTQAITDDGAGNQTSGPLT